MKKSIQNISFTVKDLEEIDLLKNKVNILSNASFHMNRDIAEKDIRKRCEHDIPGLYNQQQQDVNGTVCWRNIPMQHERFLNALLLAKDYIDSYAPTFLDIGCGFGFLCNIARHAGFKPTGIEIDKDVIEMGKTLFNSSYDCVHFINKDIQKFKDYGKYKVLYIYMPIKSEIIRVGNKLINPLDEFINKVIDDMAVDAFLILADYSATSDRLKKINTDNYSMNVYKKIK